MNNTRIRQYVDEVFAHVKESKEVREQKEELIVNITERVKDYMQEGLDFDTAFETAKNALGDTDELTKSFKKATPAKNKFESWTLTALSPFIFIFLGFSFGWWAWAWVIIPVSAVLAAPIGRNNKIVALMPFVYVLLGFWINWWAWGWVIIPVAAILSAGIKRGEA